MYYFRKSIKSFQRGFLMLEILIVSSVVVIAIIIAMNVAQKSINLSREAIHQSQSAFLLEEGAEIVRIIRDNAWINISSLTNGTNYYPIFSGGVWTLSTTPSQIDIFTRTIIFSEAYRDANQNLATSGTLDEQTKLVTISVSWTNEGQSITRTLQFYIADLFS